MNLKRLDNGTVDSLCSLDRKCFSGGREGSAWNKQGWQGEFDRGSHIYGLYDAQTLAAFAVLEVFDSDQHRREVSLVKTAVHPEYRRRGLAFNLLKQLFERYSAADVYLEVGEHNDTALKLYERLGFSEQGRRKNYYADHSDAVILFLSF